MGIALSHRRYEEIKKIIVDLFVRYGVSCAPVTGFELATKMGIKVVQYSAKTDSVFKGSWWHGLQLLRSLL